MTSANVISETRAYVVENFLYMQRDARLKDDDLLIQKRIIDSMGVVELVHFIEDAFHVTIADDEIAEENIGSLAAIARFVSRKQAGLPSLPTSDSLTRLSA